MRFISLLSLFTIAVGDFILCLFYVFGFDKGVPNPKLLDFPSHFKVLSDIHVRGSDDISPGNCLLYSTAGLSAYIVLQSSSSSETFHIPVSNPIVIIYRSSLEQKIEQYKFMPKIGEFAIIGKDNFEHFKLSPSSPRMVMEGVYSLISQNLPSMVLKFDDNALIGPSFALPFAYMNSHVPFINMSNSRKLGCSPFSICHTPRDPLTLSKLNIDMYHLIGKVSGKISYVYCGNEVCNIGNSYADSHSKIIFGIKDDFYGIDAESGNENIVKEVDSKDVVEWTYHFTLTGNSGSHPFAFWMTRQFNALDIKHRYIVNPSFGIVQVCTVNKLNSKVNIKVSGWDFNNSYDNNNFGESDISFSSLIIITGLICIAIGGFVLFIRYKEKIRNKVVETGEIMTYPTSMILTESGDELLLDGKKRKKKGNEFGVEMLIEKPTGFSDQRGDSILVIKSS